MIKHNVIIKKVFFIFVIVFVILFTVDINYTKEVTSDVGISFTEYEESIDISAENEIVDEVKPHHVNDKNKLPAIHQSKLPQAGEERNLGFIIGGFLCLCVGLMILLDRRRIGNERK